MWYVVEALGLISAGQGFVTCPYNYCVLSLEKKFQSMLSTGIYIRACRWVQMTDCRGTNNNTANGPTQGRGRNNTLSCFMLQKQLCGPFWLCVPLPCEKLNKVKLTHLDVREEALILKNVALDSLATAFAWK